MVGKYAVSLVYYLVRPQLFLNVGEVGHVEIEALLAVGRWISVIDHVCHVWMLCTRMVFLFDEVSSSIGLVAALLTFSVMMASIVALHHLILWVVEQIVVSLLWLTL